MVELGSHGHRHRSAPIERLLTFIKRLYPCLVRLCNGRVPCGVSPKLLPKGLEPRLKKKFKVLVFVYKPACLGAYRMGLAFLESKTPFFPFCSMIPAG
jgi:hypothetical protein